VGLAEIVGPEGTVDPTWVILGVSIIVAFLTRRWITVAIPLIGSPLYVIGLNKGWWGCCRTGENSEVITGMFTVAATLVTGAAVEAGQRFANRSYGERTVRQRRSASWRRYFSEAPARRARGSSKVF
jgi:hypothetical protein